MTEVPSEDGTSQENRPDQSLTAQVRNLTPSTKWKVSSCYPEVSGSVLISLSV